MCKKKKKNIWRKKTLLQDNFHFSFHSLPSLGLAEQEWRPQCMWALLIMKMNALLGNLIDFHYEGYLLKGNSSIFLGPIFHLFGVHIFTLPLFSNTFNNIGLVCKWTQFYSAYFSLLPHLNSQHVNKWVPMTAYFYTLQLSQKNWLVDFESQKKKSFSHS